MSKLGSGPNFPHLPQGVDLAALARNVARDGLAILPHGGHERIVVASYTDGFNLIGGHGVPVRLAMLRGLHDGIGQAMGQGPLAKDYRDLYGVWCGLEILRQVVERKKLPWGDGSHTPRREPGPHVGAMAQATRAPGQGQRAPALRSRQGKGARPRNAAASSHSGDLLSLIAWDMRPFPFDEVNVPRLVAGVRAKAHEALFAQGPTVAAAHLHLGILRELHRSYGQAWQPEDEEGWMIRLRKNQRVQVGNRDLRYQARDLPLLLSYYGVGDLAPIHRMQRYTVRYWSVHQLLRLQAGSGRVDLRRIPWMQGRYVRLEDLAGQQDAGA